MTRSGNSDPTAETIESYLERVDIITSHDRMVGAAVRASQRAGGRDGGVPTQGVDAR